MNVYSTKQPARPSFRTLIDDKCSPELFIPRHVIDEIRYLNDRNKNREWSGILFYTITDGNINDMNSLKLQAQGILLKDIGSASSTSYEFSGDVVEYMDNIAEKLNVDSTTIYTNWKIGHHHSHQQMGVTPSSTDTEEIEDNIKNHVAYLTTITNNNLDISAFISVYAQIDYTNSYTIKDHNNHQHNFINDGHHDAIFKYKVKVIWEDDVQVSDNFKNRYTEISTKTVPSTSIVTHKRYDNKMPLYAEREKEFKQMKLELEEDTSLFENDMDMDKLMLIDLIMHFDNTILGVTTVNQALKMAARVSNTPYLRNKYFTELDDEIDKVISTYAIDEITYEERDTQIRDMMDLLLDETHEFAKIIHAHLNNKLTSHLYYHG